MSKTTESTTMVAVVDGPPSTKSSDSDVCIDQIECFPKQYDCRNNPTVSESYSKFEQEIMTIYTKELQTKQLTADQHLKLIQQQSFMTQEQYDNKLAIAKLMIKQMNHHHHLQEQKYMHEIQMLREMFNLSEQQWKVHMNSVDEQLLQQQRSHAQIIAELRDEMKQYNEQNQIYATESQKSASNFDSARIELNDLIASNQIIVQTLESKIDKQSSALFTFQADTTAEKEEMELMVQSWMTQCEALQQQVHDLQAKLTSTEEAVEEASTTQYDIKTSIEKMGQTYENVLEHVMEQIQEQTDLQNTNYNQIQISHSKLQRDLEGLTTMTSEKISQVEQCCTLQAAKIGSMEEQYESLNGGLTNLSESLHSTNGDVSDLKESLKEQCTAQSTIETDVAGMQGIVAKLADASNSRFVRMETTFEHEVKSVKAIKKEIDDALEANQERVKSVDNKIVIHSIQLGEMSKEIKDMSASVSLLKDDHRNCFASIQTDFKDFTVQIDIQNESQRQTNENVTKSIASLQNASKDVELRTNTVERCVDTMTARIDQFQDDHSKTRGNFLEQHQCIETNFTAQLQVLKQQISEIQQITKKDIQEVAEAFDTQMKLHQGKIDECDAIKKNLNALTASTIKRHESSEANAALLQADVRDIKQNIHKIDQEHSLRLNDHIKYAKSKLQHITEIVIPDQLESNKLLRACFVDIESSMKERHEKTNKKLSDRVDHAHDKIATIQNTIDEICKIQSKAKTDGAETKQSIEKIVTDLGALNDSITLEVAHGSELLTKLHEVASTVELQSAKVSAIESALESNVAEIRKVREQSEKDLNHSLTQVLTLSHMKEAMVNQIADCLVRLTALDASKAEHTKKIKEISLQIVEHSMKIQTMDEESKSKLCETESTLESNRIAFDALKHDVQKQREVQKGVNDFVSESVAACAVSISEIEKRTDSFNLQLDDMTKNLNSNITASEIEISKIMSILEQQDDKRKDIESKFIESEISMQEYCTKTSQDITKTQSLVKELKLTVDRHNDRLKTAKDARIVIRNDLKTLVDSMNEQFECVRNQISKNNESFSQYLECMMNQTRDELLCNGNETETQSKIEFLAGRFKAMHENSKFMRETIETLQNEIGQWKNRTDQEVISQSAEMTSKLEYITGKFKAMNDKTKQNHESIVQIQDVMAKYKSDQDSNEKTTELIEEISSKIDYLAGKFKSLNDHAKSTNATINSLQDQVTQMSKQQSIERELVQGRLTENEQIFSNAMTSKLFVEFSDLKDAFDEIKAQQKIQSTPKKSHQDVQVLARKIEDMKNEIDKMSTSIQNLVSAQHTVKGIPTEVGPSSSQIKQNDDEAIDARGMCNIKAISHTIMKQHGEQNELVNVTLHAKRINHREKVETNWESGEVEIYHEARDVEEITSNSPAEQRDQV